MANSREAQFQWGVTKAMAARGWKAGTVGGYDRKGEYVSERDLTHYHLIKRNEKRLRLEGAEGDYGLTPVSEAVFVQSLRPREAATGRDHRPPQRLLRRRGQ